MTLPAAAWSTALAVGLAVPRIVEEAAAGGFAEDEEVPQAGLLPELDGADGAGAAGLLVPHVLAGAAEGLLDPQLLREPEPLDRMALEPLRLPPKLPLRPLRANRSDVGRAATSSNSRVNANLRKFLIDPLSRSWIWTCLGIFAISMVNSMKSAGLSTHFDGYWKLCVIDSGPSRDASTGLFEGNGEALDFGVFFQECGILTPACTIEGNSNDERGA